MPLHTWKGTAKVEIIELPSELVAVLDISGQEGLLVWGGTHHHRVCRVKRLLAAILLCALLWVGQPVGMGLGLTWNH